MSSNTMSVLVAGRASVNSGVQAKLAGVANALTRDGYSVSLVLSPYPGIRGSRILQRAVRESQAEVIYVRQDYALLSLIPFFAIRRMRKKRNILDIPTPMSSHHLESLSGGLPLPRRVAKLVANWLIAPFLWWTFDVLLEYAPEKSRWAKLGNKRRIRTIRNGIDVSSRTLRGTRTKKPTDQTIHLLGLGVTQPGYGLDRILRALAQERVRGNPIQFRLVATGLKTSNRENLVALVAALNIGDIVDIRDEVHGVELDNLVSWADVGIGVLAGHRVGLHQASPLKHREYLARGLPFIYACEDTALRGTEYFALRVSSNDEILDMDAVESWARAALSVNAISADCRRHAEQHMSLSSEVLPYLVGEG